MTDFSSMPTRFYKIYQDKIRDMPSLRTDDIPGARPRRTNYPKAEILDRYNTVKSQAYVNKEPKTYLFGSPFDAMREEFLAKNQASSPQLTNKKSLDNYQSAQEQQQSQQNDKYSNVNSMRNPLFADHNYSKSLSPVKARHGSHPMVQDSLDLLNSQYGGKVPSQSEQVVENNVDKYGGMESRSPASPNLKPSVASLALMKASSDSPNRNYYSRNPLTQEYALVYQKGQNKS